MNPYLEVVLASVIWGTTGIFAKLLHLHPASFTFIRSFAAALFILAYFIIKKRRLNTKGNRLIYLTAFLNAPRILLYFFALSLTTVGNVVIIEYTYPVFITLFSSLYLKEKISMMQIFVLLLAFAGILVMYGSSTFSLSNRDFVGLTAVLGSTLIFVINSLIIKKVIHRHSRLEIVLYQNLIPACILLPFFLIVRPLPTPIQWTFASVHGVLIGVVAFALYFSALRKIDLSTASIITYLEVVSAIFFSVIFLKETLTWNIVVGGSLILLATILLHGFSSKPVSEINPA